MIALYHPDHPEVGVKTVENDSSSVLLRKGWIKVPNPPDFDPVTHEARFKYGKWIVKKLLIAPVPERITRRQLQLWLHRKGLLTKVKAEINHNLSSEMQAEAKIEWDTAQEIIRNHPLTLYIINVLGMTEEQGDNAFREASQI